MKAPGTNSWPRGRRLAWALLACGASCLIACAPEIGDECETALDCSSSGTRLCDRTQPNGYCSLEGCEKGTCPEESVCVKFNPDKDRLAKTYCMYECEDDSDCRDDEGYECLRARAPGRMPEPLSDPGAFGSGLEAEVLDGASHKFCAVRSEIPMSVPDAGMSMPPDEEDGGTMSSGG
jgi:hypothetical protein